MELESGSEVPTRIAFASKAAAKRPRLKPFWVSTLRVTKKLHALSLVQAEAATYLWVELGYFDSESPHLQERLAQQRRVRDVLL